MCMCEIRDHSCSQKQMKHYPPFTDEGLELRHDGAQHQGCSLCAPSWGSAALPPEPAWLKAPYADKVCSNLPKNAWRTLCRGQCPNATPFLPVVEVEPEPHVACPHPCPLSVPPPAPGHLPPLARTGTPRPHFVYPPRSGESPGLHGGTCLATHLEKGSHVANWPRHSRVGNPASARSEQTRRLCSATMPPLFPALACPRVSVTLKSFDWPFLFVFLAHASIISIAQLWLCPAPRV